MGIICDIDQYCEELLTDTLTAEGEEDIVSRKNTLLSHTAEMSHRFQF
jgi:hypothetical protein